MIELKPITTPVRKLGWKPTFTMRMPGGTLDFTDDKYKPGIFAYGTQYDYCIRMEGTTAYVGQFPFDSLYGAEMPSDETAVRFATIPNTTRNAMIRLCEEWEVDQ